MRRPIHRLLAGFAGGLLAAFSVAPVVTAAAATAQNVENLDEAWFLNYKEPLAKLPSGDPTCQVGACNASGAATRPDPRPQNTLQVGANLGESDTTTAFTFDLSQLPPDAVISGGTTALPALGQDAGTVNASKADMVACLTTGLLVASQDAASFEARPEFDCKTASSPLVAKSDGGKLVYTVDLAPFAAQWQAGVPNNGLSIVPSDKAKEERRTFNVAFPSKRNDKTDDQIMSTLQYTVAEPAPAADNAAPPMDMPPPPAFDDTSSGGFNDGFSDGGFGETFTDSAPADFGADFDPVASAVAPEPALDMPLESGPAPLAAAQDTFVQSATPVAAAGGVDLATVALWLLPIVGLALAGTLGYSLSQPVQLPAEREGAVSKLMRRRRFTRSGPPITA